MRRALLFTLLFCACGDDDMSVDASVDGETPIGPATPTAPTPPVLTVDGACESNWARIDVEGFPSLCEPFPDGVRNCEAHEAHFAGEDACRAPGRACADEFPPAPSGATAVYVRAGSSGDGSESAPFGTIADALGAVPSGGVVLVAAGTYSDEDLVVRRDVTIRGACVANTRLVAPTADESGWIVRVADGARLTVEDLQMSGPRTAMVVDEGAALEARGIALVNLREAGIVTFGETLVEDAVVRHTDVESMGSVHLGIAAYQNAVLNVRNAVIRGHADLNAQVRGATATFEDVVFGLHFDTFEGNGGRGVEAAQSANVTVRRGVFHDSSVSGALAADAGTTLLVEGSMFSGLSDGAAVAAIGDAHVRVSRLNIFASFAGIVASGGADVEAADVLISGDGADVGFGIELTDADTSARLERVLVVAAPTSGIATRAGATSTLSDVTILDGAFGRELELGQFALGLVYEDASGTLDRVLLNDNRGFGVLVVRSELDGRDIQVVDTAALPITGVGTALRLQESRVTIERVLLENNLGSSLVAIGETSNVEVSHLTVHGTRRAGCLDSECASFIGGVGLGVYAGARLRAENFSIADNELLGAQIAFGVDEDGERAPPGDLTLAGGTIARNPFGINVQVPDYDYDRFQNIEFIDNGRNFDSTIMGVPRPPEF